MFDANGSLLQTVNQIRREALSIGEGNFVDRFARWNLPDLDGWFVSRGSTTPYDTYAQARAWAFR